MKEINTHYQKKSARIVMLFCALLLSTSSAKAQIDEFGEEAPAPDFGSGPTSGSGVSAKPTSGQGGNDLLNKNKKQKFNRSSDDEISNAKFPETIDSFDFPNVEITDIAKAISELTGKNFIVDPGVRGKITIIAPSKITVAEAYKAFLSALAINGYTVVPSGGFLKIKSARNAQRDSIETYSGAYYPTSDQMITKIIHLKHILADQVNRDLRILTSKDGDMAVYPATNSIILSDFGSNIDRVMKILNQLDVPGFEEQLEVIPIKFAKAKDLADLVDKIVNKGDKSGGANRPGTFSAGVPRFSRSGGTTSQQGAGVFTAIPDDRTNTIIAVGNKSGILRIKKLIAQLDFKIKAEDSGGVFVYYVRNGDAEKIAQTLSGVTKDTTPKPSTSSPGGFGGPSFGSPFGAPGAAGNENQIFGGDVKITADKATNSLVIVASKQDYDTVMNLLSKIDMARDQVFVEAIIMEIRSSDNNQWGAGYYQYGNNGYGKTGFNGGVNIGDFINPIGEKGAILSFASGGTVDVTDPTTSKVLKIPSLVGLIKFIKSTTKANILSTPQITVLDNQEGELEVGDKIITSVTTTQATSTSGAITSPVFENATIKLNIKPFVSPSSETIRMEIKQSIKQKSTVPAPKALTDSVQQLASRDLKTNIVVANGDTAVLGGLTKEEETEQVDKVPLLGDIPIIGWLFKSRTAGKEKVNMVMFLTPKIIRNPADQKSVVDKRLADRLDFVKSQGGREPFGKKIDEISRRTAVAPLPLPAPKAPAPLSTAPSTPPQPNAPQPADPLPNDDFESLQE
ncbi:MAG: type II secretion system secretin GspD [Pseudobdellovibrionaceae bacterium]